jgi:xanthine dehydrogenase YagS FAD-binding subunit
MKDFSYIAAGTIDEAVSLLGQGGAQVIAGGTDILGRLKAMMSANLPRLLVDIKPIADLYRLSEDDGILTIGSLVKLSDIAESTIIRDGYAVLAEAARRVATPELRNMGTIGGNICQSVRCWYYRAEHNTFNCLRKNPTGMCYAINGDNRYHSILGAVSGCLAVNPGNMAPALIALNASIVTSKRTVTAGDFFSVNGEKTTVLDDDEIVIEIRIPKPAAGTRSAFIKFALRKSFDFPIVDCAAVINGSQARICLNAVYNLPYRATVAEDTIAGREIDETSAQEAAEAALSDASPLSMNGYKIQIARAMVKRAILNCR